MTAWSPVFDSIASQLALQRRALEHGTPPPPALDIDPPDIPLDNPLERIRAISLLEESERLADRSVELLVDTSFRRSRPYAPRWSR